MPSTNDERGTLPLNSGDVIEEALLFLESVGEMVNAIRAAGVSDPMAVEQITYIMVLMTIPADNDPAAFADNDKQD